MKDLIRLDSDVFSSKSTKVFHDYVGDSRYTTFGFLIRGKLFGFLVVDSYPIGPKNPNEKRIETFVVDSSMQGLGIGKKLLQHALSEFPYHHFSLVVRPNNTSAIKLYKSMGFESIDNKYMVLKRSGLRTELTEEGFDVTATLRDIAKELRLRNERATSKLRRKSSK